MRDVPSSTSAQLDKIRKNLAGKSESPRLKYLAIRKADLTFFNVEKLLNILLKSCGVHLFENNDRMKS